MPRSATPERLRRMIHGVHTSVHTSVHTREPGEDAPGADTLDYDEPDERAELQTAATEDSSAEVCLSVCLSVCL